MSGRTRDKARGDGPRRSAIRVFLLGHECLHTYWRCRSCGYYSVESYWDTWDGEDPTKPLGTLSAEVGEYCIALLAACPDPMDQDCECVSHKVLHYGKPQSNSLQAGSLPADSAGDG